MHNPAWHVHRKAVTEVFVNFLISKEEDIIKARTMCHIGHCILSASLYLFM